MLSKLHENSVKLSIEVRTQEVWQQCLRKLSLLINKKEISMWWSPEAQRRPEVRSPAEKAVSGWRRRHPNDNVEYALALQSLLRFDGRRLVVTKPRRPGKRDNPERDFALKEECKS